MMRTENHNKIHISIAIFSILLLITACQTSQVPKPRGHFRIDLPEKSYMLYDTTCPFTFEYPVYSILEKEPGLNDYCWFNIVFPDYNGKIYLSYMQIENNLQNLTEDAHKLAYKHSVKADAIEEKLWVNNSKNVFGMIYNIKGNAASAVQFFVTDSINHYLRGSLYFNSIPDKDSLSPVIDFFSQDIIHLIETIEWK